jgi:hypothetical protein
MNETQIKKSICNKILKILEPYVYKPYIDIDLRQELESVKNKKVRAPFNRSIEIPLGEYLFASTMTLHDLNIDNYYEAVFSMSRALKNCTGKINIQRRINETGQKEYYFYINEEKRYINMDDQPLIKTHFYDVFLKRYTDCRYRFTSIAINMNNKEENNGHQNILFILTTKKSIYLNIYEPNGSIATGHDKFFKDIREKLIDNIKTILLSSDDDKVYQRKRMPDGTITRIKRKDIIVAPFNQTSAIIGFQSYIKDNQGFCSLISAFWLYILLEVMQVSTNQEKLFIFKNMKFIEKCVMHNYNQDKLYDIIIYFTNNVLSISLALAEMSHGQKFKDIFKKNIEKNLFFTLSERRALRLTTDSYHEFIDKLYQNFYYTDEQYVIKEDGDINEYVKKDRKEDGLYCKQDKECISDNCINNKCTPYIRGSIGSECKEDDQCISNYCDLKENKCQPYDYQNKDKILDDNEYTPFKRSLKPIIYHPYSSIKFEKQKKPRQVIRKNI